MATLRVLRERRLLRHVVGDLVIDGGVVVDAVAAADDHVTSWAAAARRKPMRGEKLFLSGLTREAESAR